VLGDPERFEAELLGRAIAPGLPVFSVKNIETPIFISRPPRELTIRPN
jgi:hypothetical protein